MPKLHATIELNTPALGGGSEPRNADPYFHLRPSAVRGALRAWFRASAAEALWPSHGVSEAAQLRRNQEMVDDLRKLEERIFGSTRLRSSVRLAPPGGGHIDAWNPQPAGDTGLGYLGYGVFASKAAPPTRLTTRRGQPLTLSFVVRPLNPPKEAPLTAAQVLPVLASSIWSWCAFGGVGARWRRGFGSMRLAGLTWDVGEVRQEDDGGELGLPLLRAFSNLTKLPRSHDEHLAALVRGLDLCHRASEGLCRATRIGTALLKNDAVAPHPNIRSLAGIKSIRTLIGSGPDPLVVLDAAGTLLRGYRSSLERKQPLPDYHAVKDSIRNRRQPDAVGRAAFGLPLGFFFRSLGNEKTRFVPEPPRDLASTLEHGIKLDRVPSPLIIRVHALQGRNREPDYGVTLVNMAGKDTTALLGCGLRRDGVDTKRGTIPPPDPVILDDFIAEAVKRSKEQPRLMVPPPRPRRRRR